MPAPSGMSPASSSQYDDWLPDCAMTVSPAATRTRPVAQTVRAPNRAMVVITHYQRLLNYIVPDVVHVLSKGRIVKTGGKELALELEARGYAEYQEAAA